MASILQARDLICQNIASLAKRQKLDRAKTQNVQGLIQLTSKARHTVDCSAGLLPLLQHLLASQPQAFVPPSNGRSAEQGGKTMERGGLERGGGGVGDGGGFSQTPPSIPSMAGLVQHLAADESACYAVSFVDPLGVESIWCNQRMSDLFMTSEGKRVTRRVCPCLCLSGLSAIRALSLPLPIVFSLVPTCPLPFLLINHKRNFKPTCRPILILLFFSLSLSFLESSKASSCTQEWALRTSGPAS